MGSTDKVLSDGWYVKDRLPCRWTRIELQVRDIRLLRILLEQKFLSKKQIEDYFFDGKERYAYIRIWKLRRFNLVRRLWIDFTGDDLYMATEAGHEFFKDQFVELPPPFISPDLRTISHDLLVTDIRFLFEQIGFGSSWMSERIWRLGRSVRLWAPDAVIRVGGDPFALEVECMQKMDRRYEEIFSRYQEDSEVAGCLYITSDEKLLNALMEKAKGFSRIYFVAVRDLFDKKAKTAFCNFEHRAILLEDNLEKTEGSVGP